MKSLLLITAACGIATASYANVVSMNFDTADTTDLSALISATPSAGQFSSSFNVNGAASNPDRILSSQISNNTLVSTRSQTANGNHGSLTRSFSALPWAIVTFDADFAGARDLVLPGSNAHFAINMFLNEVNGYTNPDNNTASNASAPDVNGTAPGRPIAVSFLSFVGGTAGWSVNLNGTAEATRFMGTQTITWVVNNSGNVLNYTDPANNANTVADDSAVLWVGDTLIADNLTTFNIGAAPMIEQFMFRWQGNTTYAPATDPWTLTLDNLTIVPEPSTYAILFGGIVLCFVALRRRK